jgi:hypothetical protein
LKLSEAQTRVSEFRPWEVPILQQIHGAELVQVVGEKDYPKIEYPEAQVEYERLGARYKSPEGSNQPYVELVFGLGGHNLGRAIEAAQIEAGTREAIAYVEPKPFDSASNGYLQAERDALVAERRALEKEKAEIARQVAEREAQAAVEKAAQDQAAKDSIAAQVRMLAEQSAKLEAAFAELAKEKAKVAEERAEVVALLDSATATPATLATPAAPKCAKGAKAQPISE